MHFRQNQTILGLRPPLACGRQTKSLVGIHRCIPFLISYLIEEGEGNPVKHCINGRVSAALKVPGREPRRSPRCHGDQNEK